MATEMNEKIRIYHFMQKRIYSIYSTSAPCGDRGGSRRYGRRSALSCKGTVFSRERPRGC